MDEQNQPIQKHATCIQCGYALRGLASDAQCPECGMAIEISLASMILQSSSIEQVKAIYEGAAILMVCCLTALIVPNVSFLIVIAHEMGIVGFDLLEFIGIMWVLGGILMPMICWSGAWHFSTPPPDMAKNLIPKQHRRFREYLLLSAFLAIALFVSILVSWMLTAILGAALLLSFVAVFFTMQNYIMWIASRMPDQSIRARAKLHRWLIPAIVVVIASCAFIDPGGNVLWLISTFCMVIGSLCCVLWSHNIHRLKKRLRTIIMNHESWDSLDEEFQMHLSRNNAFQDAGDNED